MKSLKHLLTTTAFVKRFTMPVRMLVSMDGDSRSDATSAASATPGSESCGQTQYCARLVAKMLISPCRKNGIHM